MSRTRPDSCPGALTLHHAADGPLARIRLPGGVLTPAQVLALADASREVGNGAIELTSRGNVQLRAVRSPDELAARLQEAGLLPSASHERVRNIVASPLSGRVGGLADVRDLVTHLDAELQARPALADLPGRVLFTLDDGRGDVSGLGPDIGLHATTPHEFALVLAGHDTGVRLPADTAIAHLLTAAEAFVDIRTEQWRLAEIENGRERVLTALPTTPSAETVALPISAHSPVGWLEQDDGRVALGAGVRLGSLDARLAEFLAATERPLIVTPWRTLLLCDLDDWAAEQVVRVLAPMGLIFDADSPWLQVSACAGRPGCAKSLTDVRADVARAVATGEVEGRQHWSGCERRCGRPTGPAIDVVATADGTYQINSTPVSDAAKQ